MSNAPDKTNRMIAAGLLTWLLPGAGHLYLGHRRLAAVFLCGITIPYLTGVAIGGVKTSVNPHLNKWLFLAELGAGGLTTGFYMFNNALGGIDARTTADVIRRAPSFAQLPPERQQALTDALKPYVAYYPASDIAQIYLAAAGLLNLLAILDAMTRAQTGGLPVYYHELPTEQPAAAGVGG